MGNTLPENVITHLLISGHSSVINTLWSGPSSNGDYLGNFKNLID